jgi:Zn-finger nucleic acid-binding protein
MAVWTIGAQLQGAVLGAAGYRGSEAQIHGCHGCGGAWVDRRTLDEVVARAETFGATDPSAAQRRTMVMSATVVYRTCPRCEQQMNRRNFARYSGIVVDECRACGTFFDVGELEGVVAFVRSGGLALSKQRDAEEAKRDRFARVAVPSTPMLSNPAQAECDVVVWFLAWIGRWLRRIATG